LVDYLLNNVFFDTCAYHRAGIELFTKIIPVLDVVFASKIIAAVQASIPLQGTFTTTPARLYRRDFSGSPNTIKRPKADLRRTSSRCVWPVRCAD
jgi:4-oxalmesaconate hydratase